MDSRNSSNVNFDEKNVFVTSNGNAERNVIQLKKSFLLKELLSLVKFVYKAGSNSGLITTLVTELVDDDYERQRIKLKPSEYESLNLLIEYLSKSCNNEIFDKLVNIMGDYEISKNASVELVLYFKVETGELKPSEVLLFEAGMYEHEETGCSKRRSQNDKKVLKSILLKQLLSRHHVEDIKTEGLKTKLSMILTKLEAMIITLNVMFEKLQYYVSEHDTMLCKTVTQDETYKMKTLMSKNKDKEDKFEEFMQILKVLVLAFFHCLSEIKNYNEEKGCCVTILKSQDLSIPLDINIADTFKRNDKKIKDLKQAIIDWDQKAVELNEELIRLNELKNTEASKKENSWKTVKRTMTTSLDDLILTSDKISQNKQRIIDANNELEMWIVYVNMLAKSEQLKRTNHYNVIVNETSKPKPKVKKPLNKSKIKKVKTSSATSIPRYKTYDHTHHRLFTNTKMYSNKYSRHSEVVQSYLENFLKNEENLTVE